LPVNKNTIPFGMVFLFYVEDFLSEQAFSYPVSS